MTRSDAVELALHRVGHILPNEACRNPFGYPALCGEVRGWRRISTLRETDPDTWFAFVPDAIVFDALKLSPCEACCREWRRSVLITPWSP